MFTVPRVRSAVTRVSNSVATDRQRARVVDPTAILLRRAKVSDCENCFSLYSNRVQARYPLYMLNICDLTVTYLLVGETKVLNPD